MIYNLNHVFFSKSIPFRKKMWYTKYNIIFFQGGIVVKNIWRALWLAAVSLGGVALVRIAMEILNREQKKYIDL